MAKSDLPFGGRSLVIDADLPPNLVGMLAKHGINAASGFVKEEYLGLSQELYGYGDSLALATGELSNPGSPDIFYVFIVYFQTF